MEVEVEVNQLLEPGKPKENSTSCAQSASLQLSEH